MSKSQSSTENSEHVGARSTAKIIELSLIDSVWAANKVSFDLYTIDDKQFVAYYDKNRMMTVASRKLESNTWQKKTLSSKLAWDSHNYVTMGFDEKGGIHVSGNMHADPLVYFRSERPYDIHSLVEVNSMTAKNERSITYPKFFNGHNGTLLYMYRTGGSGRGDTWVNRYDTNTKKWEPYVTNGIFKGISENESRSAYNKFIKGPEGNFHYVWMWRWTPEVETCHQLCYATSSDFLNWKNAQGEEVPLPFTPDNTKLIVDDVPSKGGLHNSRYDITVLKDGTPIIGYLKYDENGFTQLYLSRFENGQWFSKKVSDWNFRWKFMGGGDQMTKGATFNFVEPYEGQTVVIAWSTENGEKGSYYLDSKTFEPLSQDVPVIEEYPAAAREKVTEHAELSVNLQRGKTRGKARNEKHLLKWESMKKSHAKHAPKVIPEGPLSPLYLIEFQNSISDIGGKMSQSDNRLTSLDLNMIRRVKGAIEKNDPAYLPAYRKLIKDVDIALSEGPFSVVNKTQTPISGNKHDYLSLGPYWWPDPDETDGLPWIRKDGEVNPLTRGENVDEPRKRKMFGNVFKLGLAYFFSEEKKYADKAIELLEVWFLNEKTKMNAHLNYAQGIPGRNNGRGIGIIEFLTIDNVITAIELLELRDALDEETGNGLRKWMTEYLVWLQTSENGISEKNWKNNHGTWYDVQEVVILLFLDRKQEAMEVLERVKLKRIATQIEGDGKQPHELERTKSLSYSIMNLKGFTQLAYYGNRLDVDLLNYEPPNGGGIRKAYDFLYPYAIGKRKWQFPQLGGAERQIGRLQDLFLLAGSMFDIEEYCEIQSSTFQGEESILLLLHPCAKP